MTNTTRIIKFAFVIFPLIFTQPALPQETKKNFESERSSLCLNEEDVVLSFEIKRSKKTASLCKEKSERYLVYRFGIPDKIELEYPPSLDPSSWEKFSFSGYNRGGGPKNDAMGDYTLEFSTTDADYAIIQNWRLAPHQYYVGISVQTKDRKSTLEGRLRSQRGSLLNLENTTKIKNERNN